MFFIIGVVVVIGSVIGGYLMHGGRLGILWQPNEVLIIFGSGIGAFVIANPMSKLKKCLGGLKVLFKPGDPYSKESYLELLTFMYNIFKFMKTKGLLEIEKHIENPEESDFFKPYPGLIANHHAVDFFCDYLRLLTMGVDNKYQLEDMMDKELDAHHHDNEVAAGSMTTLGDSFPALGIVAAVLGVITTMGSISEPPEILGGLIGAALVGTFLGILLCYGIFGPIGQFMGKYYHDEHKYYECIKIGLLAHVQGNAPAVSVEFARKMIPGNVMPSFKEVEAAMQGGAAPA